MKILSLAALAVVAYVALIVVMATPPKKPEPPVPWCWVSVPGMMLGLPCRYRSGFIDV